MYKLATVGALVAALGVPASAAGHGLRAHHAVAERACPDIVVIMPTRGYGFCGGRVWVRDPQTGQLTTTPLWRVKLRSDRPDDHP